MLFHVSQHTMALHESTLGFLHVTYVKLYLYCICNYCSACSGCACFSACCACPHCACGGYAFSYCHNACYRRACDRCACVDNSC